MFGQQFHWVVSSDTPFDDTFDESVTFWVINETQLSGSGAVGVSRVELLASSISSLGSASITGLYIIVLVTVGAYFRSFLVPDVTTNHVRHAAGPAAHPGADLRPVHHAYRHVQVGEEDEDDA